jgi:ABC-2 type transport system ATP-binding protein
MVAGAATPLPPPHGGRSARLTRISSVPVSAIAVSGLRKSYGAREVLHGISFTVEAGEVFALLGPNGAGKTTTVEILEGYRRRDGGDVRVLGEDPGRAGSEYRARIGIVLQSSAVYPLLSVEEIVGLFAGYYPSPRRPDEAIELVGLGPQRDARVRTLSGGQLRRLDLALALVGDPELVFLDEPTTGFDPAARRQAWETIRDLRSLGKSILLTTHYIEEAQRLADRVAILRAGEIVGTGSPSELLSGHASVEIRFRRNGSEVVVATEEPTRVLHELTSQALADGVELEGLEVHRRTLEDVYLDLTHQDAP